MKSKITAALLCFALLLALCVGAASAASGGTVEEALGEVNIYNGDFPMKYLCMRGTVQRQNYIYFNYVSASGVEQEIPAYCINPTTKGVHKVVGPHESVKYLAEEACSDPKIVGIIASGYPHRSLEELGLGNKYQAFYATKMALWCYLIDSWSIDKLTINPTLTGDERVRAELLLKATKDIYARGSTWTSVPHPSLTVTADREYAYPVTIDGAEYYQQIFTVQSETLSSSRISVSFTLPDDVPSGTRIVTLSNQNTSSVAMEPAGSGSAGQFKVLYPKAAVEAGSSGAVQLSFRGQVHQYAVFYALCAQTDEYGALQRYMCDTDPTTDIRTSTFSRFSVDPEPEPSTTTLVISKKETGTDLPLSGAEFEVKCPDGTILGSFSTGPSGKLVLPITLTGQYVITEKTAPAFHLLSSEPTKTVSIAYGDTGEVVFYNDPYGTLRVQKVDGASGRNLPGARIQIKHIESGTVHTAVTDLAGCAYFTRLKPGAYEITEEAAPYGWIRDDKTYTVSVISGEEAGFTLKNQAKPGLLIRKYDRSSMDALADIAYELWRDGELLGEYLTDQFGEILLTNLEPGTYLVREKATDDAHVLDTTPQQIELRAGDGIRELVFFNDALPGIHLVKVDSADLSKGIANARFRFEAVDGSYGPVELTTLEDGTIDLSKLPVGAYVVTELECPGYMVDDAQRVIELRPNETAQFVFTNSAKPSLQIVKISAGGTPLPGTAFRVARIADGAHYLDRVTDTEGCITISGLEAGVYSVKELSPREGYALDETEYHVELFPGQTSQLVVVNQPLPDLEIIKTDAMTGQPIQGVTFTVRRADGSTLTTAATGADGRALLEDLEPGVYQVAERSTPEKYLLDTTPQLITLVPGKTGTVRFQNYPRPGLTIRKEDSVTGDPLQGVKFHVWYAASATDTGELRDLGHFFTDENGQIALPRLRDGWYKVEEVTPAKGYALSDPAVQEVFLKGGEEKTLLFRNQPLGNLVIEKLGRTGSKTVPLAGVKFEMKYADGKYVDAAGGIQSSNGIYYTDATGKITLSGIIGTVVVTELESVEGFTIDPKTRSQTVTVNPDDTQTLRFYNDAIGGIEIIKVSAVDRSERIPNVTFNLYRASGAYLGELTTDKWGRAYMALEDGAYYAVEVDCPRMFKPDPSPIYFNVTDGATVKRTVTNTPFSGILLRKLDSTTGSGISGADFLLYDSGHNPIGEYVSDQRGYVYIDDLEAGRYYLRELRCDGYVVDDRLKTVYVKAGETAEVTWYNTPVTGQIQLTKTSADYNPTNGWPAGAPIPGTEFEVYDRAGALVDTIRTDKDGVAISKPLPLGRYRLLESRAADFYLPDRTPIEVELQFAGQIVRAAMTNKSIRTGVSITKTGYVEVMPGQQLRYTLSGIQNASNVPLTSFYWRDALPVQAVRLGRIVTGTWNIQSTYKLIYLTNLSGGQYRTLADDLSTRQSYTLDASPAALGLAANEHITEVMAVFGVIPAGFAQAEPVRLDCTVLPGLQNGLRFANPADAGGRYGGAWVQADSRWETRVYAPAKPLPRTGY